VAVIAGFLDIVNLLEDILRGHVSVKGSVSEDGEYLLEFDI
jgi:hypothetical protein